MEVWREPSQVGEWQNEAGKLQEGERSQILSQILPPIVATYLPPFSLWICTGKLAGAGPRRPTVGQEAYAGLKGF